MADAQWVSVIIPAYNVAPYIAEALNSVLDQNWPCLEIIVVDDGSTDETGRILDRFSGRIISVFQENRGISAALNRGLEQATGEYLAFLDADDLWLPEKIRMQMDCILAHPRRTMVFTGIRNFISPDVPEPVRRSLVFPEESLDGISRQTLLLRREDFSAVGEFSPRYATGEFLDWYMRARECGFKSIVLPRMGCLRRIHGANTTLTHRSVYKDYASLLKSSLDRRRKMSR